MKHCYKCNVDINSSLDKCPLCQNEIEHGRAKDCVFPIIPTMYKKHDLMYKILSLVSIMGALLSVAINNIITNEINWSIFVIFGILCFWFTLITAIKRRNHFMKLLFAEFDLMMIVIFIWDYLTGWHLWSINYVFPFMCISYIVSMFIMRIFFKYSLNDSIIYIIINCLIGIIPLILLSLNIATVIWPSFLSGMLSIFVVILLLIFSRKKLKKELIRRFHI